jgi:mannose-6-phosphate isomerase-like protein (cupin superfamily)
MVLVVSRAPYATTLKNRSDMKEQQMDYTFFANLQQEFTLPPHSAPTPAVLYFLQGEAELQLGTDKVKAEAGSFVYMPPMLSHAISAKTGLRMLLVQMKDQS